MTLLMILILISFVPASQDDTPSIILDASQFEGAAWNMAVDASWLHWLAANAKAATRTVTGASCNSLATFTNTTVGSNIKSAVLTSVETVSVVAGDNISIVYGFGVDLASRTMSVLVQSIGIVMNTVRNMTALVLTSVETASVVAGDNISIVYGFGVDLANRTMSVLVQSMNTARNMTSTFKASFANSIHSTHQIGSNIKSVVVNSFLTASAVVGDCLDILFEVCAELPSSIKFILARGTNAVGNFMASFANTISSALQIGLYISSHAKHFVSSLSIKDQLRLAFILCLSVLLLLALWLARSYTQHIELINKRLDSLAQENSLLRMGFVAELNALDVQRMKTEEAHKEFERKLQNMSMWLNIYTKEISNKMNRTINRTQPKSSNQFIGRTLRRQNLL